MAGDLWRVEYLYRDASNYKFWGELIVSGVFNLDALRPLLFDDEFFVPQAIGLTSLVPAQRNDDDHELHKFELFELVAGVRSDITAAELSSRIRRANQNGWFGTIDARVLEQGRLGRALTALVEG